MTRITRRLRIAADTWDGQHHAEVAPSVDDEKWCRPTRARTVSAPPWALAICDTMRVPPEPGPAPTDSAIEPPEQALIVRGKVSRAALATSTALAHVARHVYLD
jgi:hypothetical protein